MIKILLMVIFTFLHSEGSNFRQDKNFNDREELSSSENAKQIQRKSDYIVGGSQARKGQFPFIASIRIAPNLKFHACGGSLISDRYVLTAAHCTVSKLPNGRNHIKSGFIFIVGSIRSDKGGDRYTVASVIPHPKFELNNHKHDIALLMSDTPVKLGPQVQIIPLQQSELDAGTSVLIAGWGRKGQKKEQSKDLMFYTSKIIDTKSCLDRRKGSRFIIWGSNFCTYTAVGVGTCMGDSGGPLVYNGHLAGLTSYGTPCANGSPDVFTKVFKYLPWIKRIMKDVGFQEQSYAGQSTTNWDDNDYLFRI